MSDVFAPKISYRIAAMYIDNKYNKMTPWEMLEDWERSDKPEESSTCDYITQKLQKHYPGNYRIVYNLDTDGIDVSYWQFEFVTSEEETMFRLKWIK